MNYRLYKGSHDEGSGKRCAMEFVAYIAGEPHSDTPVCVDAELRCLFIVLNDELPEPLRQRLRPYLVRTIGTAHDELRKQREQVAGAWLLDDLLPVVVDHAAAIWPHDAALLRGVAAGGGFPCDWSGRCPQYLRDVADALIARRRNNAVGGVVHPFLSFARAQRRRAAVEALQDKAPSLTVEEAFAPLFVLLDRLLPLETVDIPAAVPERLDAWRSEVVLV